MGYSIGAGLLALGCGGLLWLAADHFRQERPSHRADGSRRGALAGRSRWWHVDITVGGDGWSVRGDSSDRRCGSGWGGNDGEVGGSDGGGGD